jgi:hypothetical protein
MDGYERFMEVPSIRNNPSSVNDGTYRLIDVLLIPLRASLANDYGVYAFEVKVNRGDFLQEMKSEKWRVWYNLVNLFYFATPPNLVQPEEVPEECGLLWVWPSGYRRWKKIAKKNESVKGVDIGLLSSILRKFSLKKSADSLEYVILKQQIKIHERLYNGWQKKNPPDEEEINMLKFKEKMLDELKRSVSYDSQ